jgi:transcriptional regulator with XRE-family HTH domain
MITQLLGERIRTLRNQRGLSQEQLALKADLTPSFIGQIERGLKSPTITSIEKIVNALDVKFEDVFNFDVPVSKKDTSIIEKIEFLLSSRTIEEQEQLYQWMKEMLAWKDKN